MTAEYIGIDSKNNLFCQLPGLISDKREKSVYNRRNRKLYLQINEIHLKTAHSFNEFKDCFIVDGITLETPKRINQKDYKPQFCLFKKLRKELRHMRNLLPLFYKINDSSKSITEDST